MLDTLIADRPSLLGFLSALDYMPTAVLGDAANRMSGCEGFEGESQVLISNQPFSLT